MILHTLNQPPGHPLLSQCLRLITPPAALLLLEDGVYAAAAPEIIALPEEITVYALDADLQTRGVNRVAPRVRVIDAREFVQLSLDCQAMQAWY